MITITGKDWADIESQLPRKETADIYVHILKSGFAREATGEVKIRHFDSAIGTYREVICGSQSEVGDEVRSLINKLTAKQNG